MIQKLLQPSLSNQLIQMIPQSSIIICDVPSVLVVLAVKALIAFRGVATHVIWPFKEQLVLDLLQNLMYWFSEHRINHLSISGPRLPSIVSPGLIIVVSVRPEILPLLKDNLSLPLPLLLVFLDLIILINSVHKLAYTDSRFPSQRLP